VIRIASQKETPDADADRARIGKIRRERKGQDRKLTLFENSRFPLRAENERPSHPFAFAAGRSLVGQSTFALAYAAEFGYRQIDRERGWEGA